MNQDIFILEGVTLGRKVRALRILRGWRQVDLAEQASVTQNDVSQLERNGRLYPAARRRVLEALGIEEEKTEGE